MERKLYDTISIGVCAIIFCIMPIVVIVSCHPGKNNVTRIESHEVSHTKQENRSQQEVTQSKTKKSDDYIQRNITRYMFHSINPANKDMPFIPY